jgi:hypothetical protein
MGSLFGLEQRAPRATWTPGDVVLVCRACGSLNMQHILAPKVVATAGVLFRCDDCKNQTALTIERR